MAGVMGIMAALAPKEMICRIIVFRVVVIVGNRQDHYGTGGRMVLSMLGGAVGIIGRTFAKVIAAYPLLLADGKPLGGTNRTAWIP